MYQTAKRNQGECTQFLEHIYGILYAIIDLHMKSETSGELPLAVLDSHQDGNRLKQFFRQSEMNQILKEAQMGVQQALNVFKDMQRKAEEQHQKLLEYIAALSEGNTSDGSSSIQTGLTSSSSSLSLLPSQPQIFHGRDAELQDIVGILRHKSPRIAILGAGGIGKTSLARAALHHPDVVIQYESRFFIGAEAVANSIELAALIGAHLKLKPGKDLIKQVISHLSNEPACLLIVDNLETAWEPMTARAQVEELLALLADIPHLALVITMRGAERPAKVFWTRPFLHPLNPLSYAAARQTFIDIADDFHRNEDIKKLLLLTDNMPLAVNLIAHLVDYEGCLHILARWEVEKTLMLSDGHDKRSSLNASIELSLSSPRMSPGAKHLLSLLSILPDGISDVELVQTKLPIQDILTSKSTLLSTSLVYANVKGQLKALVPIREFMLAHYPPPPALIQPLQKYFYGLLDFQSKYFGNASSAGTAAGLTSNLMNIQNMLIPELHQDNPALEEAMQAAVNLNRFSMLMSQGQIPLMENIHNVLNQVNNPQLVVRVIIELFSSWKYPIAHPAVLIAQAQKCLIHITNSSLQCQLYHAIGEYYMARHDIVRAREFIDPAISLSRSIGHPILQYKSMMQVAMMKFHNGEYQEALIHACEAQRYARLSADLSREAEALRLQVEACTRLGDYKNSLLLLNRARSLMRLCGLTGGGLDILLSNSEAEIWFLKNEYAEARGFQAHNLEEFSIKQDPYNHARSLLFIANIDVTIGASPNDVHRNLTTVKVIYDTIHYPVDLAFCDIILADLELREKNYMVAKTLFEKVLKRAGKFSPIIFSCLERMGDISCWDSTDICWTSVWAISLLGHALRSKHKLLIHKSLQYLGDMFITQGDEGTAASLFKVALEGFTWMDVHQSRANCMLRLGNISYDQGDLSKAVEYWTSARPLFARSLQMKDISSIDLKLTNVDHKLQKQQEQLEHLSELTGPNKEVEKTSIGERDKDISSGEAYLHLVVN
ncbi:hypothetical protein C8R44DRAFT_745531 [Mycena epipterygia]|nr:hypothetical protein C8R44DRAFT_745531 [Mycena epipterygia]